MIAWNLDTASILYVAAKKNALRLGVDGVEFMVDACRIDYVGRTAGGQIRIEAHCTDQITIPGFGPLTIRCRTSRWSGTWRPHDEIIVGSESDALLMVRADDRLTRGEWQ